MEKKEIDKLIKTVQGGSLLFKASWEDRRRAAYALGEIKDKCAVPALIKALRSEISRLKSGENTALGPVIEALRKIGDPNAVPALIETVENSDSYVGKLAVEALVEIGDIRAAPTLLKALKNSDRSVGLRIEKNLINIRYPGIVPHLLEALKNRDFWVASAAVGGLQNFKDDPRVVPALIESLREGNSIVASALVSFKADPRIFSALIELLKEGDKEIRFVAASGLISIGMGSKAVPFLLEMLEDNDRNYQLSAIFELGLVKDTRAVPALIKALGNGYLRKDAVRVLGCINDIGSLKALEYVMKNDSDEEIRRLAFQASANIRSSRGILEEEPSHKISAGGDIMINSAKFSTAFSDNSTKISDVGMIKGNVGGKKDVPFSKCPYCGTELNLPKTPKFCPYCGDQLRE